MIESMSYIVAGLGVFFVGLKLLSSGLQQMTSRKIRMLIAQWTQKIYQGGLLGLLAGTFTQSMPALTFIVSSMVSVGMIKLRQALPIVAWGNVGLCALIFIAFLDIKLITLLLLGIVGIAHAFDRPRNYRQVVQVLFGLALILYGLQIIQASAATFAEEEWFANLLDYAAFSFPLAFLLGLFLSALSQSAIAVIILSISMTASGILTMDQSIMIIYGGCLGSSVITYLLSTKTRGTAKQQVMAQVLFNFVGVLIFVPLFYLELGTGMPLAKALVTGLADSIEMQLTYLVVLFNLVAAVIVSLINYPFASLLERFWPPTTEEKWSQMAYLHDEALHNNETALMLMELELKRLIDRFPLYMQYVREAVSKGPENHHALHNAYSLISREITSYEEELLKADLSFEASETLMRLSWQHKTLTNLDQQLYRLADLMMEWKKTSGGEDTVTPFLESTDLILWELKDALKEESKEEDKESLEMLLQITHDRSEIMQRMRKNFLSIETKLIETKLMETKLNAYEARMKFLQITSHFERTVWVINQLAKTLREQHDKAKNKNYQS